MKRFLFFFICVMSIFSTAFADISPYASQVFEGTSVSVSYSDGQVYAKAIVTTKDIASQIGFKSITIYVKNDSGGWSYVGSCSNLYDYNTSHFSHEFSVSGSEDKSYRAKAICYGLVNGISETKTVIDTR